MLAVIAVGIVIAIAVVVQRQFAGYFTTGKPRGAAVAPYASSSPSPSGASPIPQSPAPLASAPAGAPRVAIIIDDCGYSLPRDLRFLKLPIPITLSILPFTPHGSEVARDAVAAGKAVMLHLPMEPESAAIRLAPGEVTTAMDDQTVREQVEADIASLPPLPGANNHMGSKATSDPRVMRDVLGVLKQDDMFFIDSMTSYSSVGEATAHAMSVPTAQRDIFLDDDVNVPYIEGQVRALEAVARKKGVAIAIGHPFPETAQSLETMVPQMQAEGFVFVTAQSLVR